MANKRIIGDDEDDAEATRRSNYNIGSISLNEIGPKKSQRRRVKRKNPVGFIWPEKKRKGSAKRK